MGPAENYTSHIQHALKSAGIGLWEWNVHSGEINYSDEWKHLRGCINEDVGDSIEESLRRVHIEDREQLKTHRDALVAGQMDSAVCEYQVHHSNGSSVWIEERTSIVRDQNGCVSRVFGCEIDITKRKLAELELKKSEQQYAAIVESVPVGINRFEGQDCVYASQGWADLTGQPVEAALGDGWLRFIHPDDLQSVKEQRKKSMTGPPNQEVVVHDQGCRFLKAEGTVGFYEAKVRLQYGPDGKLLSETAIVIDVTESKKLERQQERLNTILEATTDFVGFANSRREIQYLNRRAREHLSFLNLDSQRDFVTCHPEWAQKITLDTAIPYAIKHGTWSGEMALLGPNNQEIPVSQVLIAHKRSDNTLEGFSTIIRDISVRKAAEKALHESEQAFSSLAAAAPVVIVRLGNDLKHKYVNKRWSEFTHRPTEASYGHGWMEAVHPDDVPVIKKTLSKFTKDETQTICEPYEVRHILPDGSINWVLVHLAKEFDENGNIQGYVGTLTDISSIKRSEQQFKEVDRRLRTVLKYSSIGIWEWSFSERKLTWDEQMFKIYGIDSEKFPGSYTDWLKCLHPDDVDRVTDFNNNRLETEDSAEIEFRIVRPTGEIRHIYSNVVAEKDENNIRIRTTGVNMDITERRAAEFALLESEKKFQRIAEHFPGMVYRYVVHPDGSDEVTYVSSGAREVFEIEPDDAIAGGIHIIWNRIHKDDHEWLGKEIAVSMDKLKSFHCEYRLNLPAKGLRWVQSFAQPIRAENGSVIWDGIVLDHTERKTAQLQLQDARTKLEGIAENVPGMIWRMSPTDDGYAITYLSSKSREMFEVEPQDVLENPEALLQYVHPDDLDAYVAGQQTAIKNKQAINLDFRIKLPEQGLRWRQCAAHPVRGDSGELVWIGMTIDITDQKMTQLALQDAQSQFQRISENVPGMIFRYEMGTDGSHALLYVSSQCRDLFEVDAEVAIENADSVFERIHPEDLPKLNEAIRISAESSQQFAMEYRVNLPSSGLRWLKVISHPERLSSGSTIWDGVVIDITDTKQAELNLHRANEELARATRMKDEFLANMSHELRTPLNAILGMTEGLQMGILGPVTDKQKNSYNVIRQSGYHLLELLNEVLDLAKIESGFTELEFSNVCIKDLCESGLQMISQQANGKNIQLQLNVPPDLPNFEADQKRIRQVLVNLLSNAVKFTPEHGIVSIEVSRATSRKIQEHDILQITVTDNGIGIAEENLDSIFLPFTQVDSSLSRNYEGTGLGLALAKRFVELHSGQIKVKSQSGKGSCFFIELPYREVDDPDSSPVATVDASNTEENTAQNGLDSDQPRSITSNATVLLAEDNDSVAAATTMYLEASNLKILRATNGNMAIEVAQEHMPDVILMDIQMPGLDGFQAIERIRKFPQMKRTPIIALSGLAMPADESRCLQSGATKYMSKPYSMSELVQAIERLLES